jgi:hypothetical protein
MEGEFNDILGDDTPKRTWTDTPDIKPKTDSRQSNRRLIEMCEKMAEKDFVDKKEIWKKRCEQAEKG